MQVLEVVFTANGYCRQADMRGCSLLRLDGLLFYGRGYLFATTLTSFGYRQRSLQHPAPIRRDTYNIIIYRISPQSGKEKSSALHSSTLRTFSHLPQLQQTMPAGFDPTALTGFSAAEAYDAHRPSYIKPAVDDLLTQLRVSGVPRAKILDLAAGTGKFTELLAVRDERYQILAVEPHQQMLAKLKEKRLRGVEVREGDAVSVPIQNGWADAVVAAQVKP